MEDLDPEHLLRLIKARKPIYDFGNTQYNNRSVIEELWIEIATEMKTGVMECKRKWACLRNSYARFLRKERLLAACGNNKKWRLAKSIAFLRDFMNLQPIACKTSYIEDDVSSPSSDSSAGNSPVPSKMSRPSLIELEKEQELMMEILKEEEPNLELIPSITKVNTGNRSFLTEITEESMFEHLQPQARKNISAKKYSSSLSEGRYELQDECAQLKGIENEPENGNTLFFKSLLIDYENLSSRSQRTFRMFMLEKMNELQEEEENDTLNAITPPPI